MAEETEQTVREAELVEAVRASFARTPDPRLRFLTDALVRHLHGFLRETRVTEQEWRAAIDFLTAAGHITDDRRQEFVLLSDVLGVSMQTIAINNLAYADATEATVLGPFFVEGAPEVELGGDIASGAAGEPCWVEGSVSDTDGKPLPGAVLEIWECDEDGFYDVQYDGDRTAARGRLHADADGNFRFWALTPVPYPIPHDGPVGALLEATERSPMRAPHLHFLVALTRPAHADHAHLRRGRGSATRRRRVRSQGVAGARRSRVSLWARRRRTGASWATAAGHACGSTSCSRRNSRDSLRRRPSVRPARRRTCTRCRFR